MSHKKAGNMGSVPGWEFFSAATHLGNTMEQASARHKEFSMGENQHISHLGIAAKREML